MVAPYIMAGASIAGGMVSASGSIKSGKAQRAAAEYNAKIQERNAKVADQAAEQILMQADRDAIRMEEIGFKFIQGQQARYGASGVVANQDTALTVALDSANNLEEQIAQRYYKSEVDAIAMREQGVDARLSANLTRLEGRARYQAARTRAMASVLGSVSRAAGAFV
jgi:hypothetical protein